jgi:hypothetical protein
MEGLVIRLDQAVRQILFRVYVPGETWLIVNWWTREAKREESILRSFAEDDKTLAVSLVCDQVLHRCMERSCDVHRGQVPRQVLIGDYTMNQGTYSRSKTMKPNRRRYQSLQLNVHQRETHGEDHGRSNGLECMAKGIISEEARTSIFNPTKTAKT